MDVFARRRLVAVLAIVLALILIGVAIAGGGDDEGAPVTKDEFIEQSDGICEEAAVSIANLSGDDPEQLAEDELSLTEAELDSLRSLAPPEQDQATLDDFFSALEDLAAALDKRLLALQRSDDNAASQADTEIATAEADVLAAAEDYGFKECGTDAESSADPGGEPTAPTDPGAVAPTTPPATTPPATTPPATTPPATPPADGGGGGGGGTGSGGISP